MYEIEDYEDHISKHRKILWLFSLVIFLGYLFCAGYAYNGAKTTDGELAAHSCPQTAGGTKYAFHFNPQKNETYLASQRTLTWLLYRRRTVLFSMFGWMGTNPLHLHVLLSSRILRPLFRSFRQRSARKASARRLYVFAETH